MESPLVSTGFGCVHTPKTSRRLYLHLDMLHLDSTQPAFFPQLFFAPSLLILSYFIYNTTEIRYGLMGLGNTRYIIGEA